MNTLDLVTDLNSRMRELDDKLNKISKSASVAFSYLYGKLENIDKYELKVNDFEDRLISIKNSVKENIDNVENKLPDIEKNISDTTITLSELKQDISELKEYKSQIDTKLIEHSDSINQISYVITDINEKLNSIIELPNNYISIKKEPSIFNKLINKISDIFYIIFHQKQIKEERKRLEEEERKRQEEAERKRQEEAEKQKRKLEEIKKKKEQAEIDKKNKIKNLLK